MPAASHHVSPFMEQPRNGALIEGTRRDMQCCPAFATARTEQVWALAQERHPPPIICSSDGAKKLLRSRRSHKTARAVPASLFFLFDDRDDFIIATLGRNS